MIVAAGRVDAGDPASFKAAFQAWEAKARTAFEEDWPKIQAVEALARPLFDEGVAAAKAGDDAKAETKLFAARAALFAHKDTLLLPLKLGLSHEIAVSLATLYKQQGKRGALKREVLLLDQGRPWMSKNDELLFHLHGVAQSEINRVRAKEANTEDLLLRYLGIYGGGQVYPDGRKVAATYKDAAQKAEKLHSALFREVDFRTEPHYTQETNQANNYKKDVVTHLAHVKVTAVKGATLVLDFRAPHGQPYDCVTSNRVAFRRRNGTVSYFEDCKWKQVTGGHTVHVPAPNGFKVVKGDLVSFYGKFSKRSGKWDVQLDDAGFVQVVRGGKSVYMFGVASKRPFWLNAHQIEWFLVDSQPPKESR
jgi:hypothetical protein